MERQRNESDRMSLVKRLYFSVCKFLCLQIPASFLPSIDCLASAAYRRVVPVPTCWGNWKRSLTREVAFVHSHHVRRSINRSFAKHQNHGKPHFQNFQPFGQQSQATPKSLHQPFGQNCDINLARIRSSVRRERFGAFATAGIVRVVTTTGGDVRVSSFLIEPNAEALNTTKNNTTVNL